ncbi:Von Willebrand factor, type A protein [Actinidia chinensis var. chinensis]|uniref:von Willebrand factor, type A protein n=1 Tax=Actinidia chinensis var. chinensis TaxID=1590841 RepID=A0A2R6PA31_ACTCC|nr:Von Willebrand factor, type A protein [Actinidia chinensis var. chinensis]
MVVGWRRAFCPSVSRDRDSKEAKEKKNETSNSNPSPRFSSKFAFFSNPSTPRLQSQPVLSPGLRCQIVEKASVPTPSAPESPKLQCKTKNSPRFFQRSNPSSPRSPSTFSLLKSSLRIHRSRCRICLHSLKTGQGTAIFTAECSHGFHFPCIAAHLKPHSNLVCPVCGTNWKELPVLTLKNNKPDLKDKKNEPADVRAKNERKQSARPDLKVYNDDEPLMSPKSVTRFNPIPELDENEDEVEENRAEEFQGFFVNASPIKQQNLSSRNVEAMLLPEAAVVSLGRGYETYAVVLKVRAPPAPAKNARRVPIDLVTVLDVGGAMTADKVQMLRRAMRLVVSSLSAADRLSIVAFAAGSKRLLPLRRMTATGRLSARRIIDALVSSQGTSSASDALKKAAKVLEDRRERNPVASIMLLSESHDSQSSSTAKQRRESCVVSTTRFAHLEIPVHSVRFSHGGALGQNPEDSFAKCVSGLLSVVVQDLRLQLTFPSGSPQAEIAAVYCSSKPAALGSGSIRIGNLYATEERELLIELKVPSSATGAHYVLSVRCCHKDPSTQDLLYGKEQLLLVPRPHAVRSSTPSIERLRSLFFTTRAVAESRLLIERNNLSAANHMLSSARALLIQSKSASANEFIRRLDAELAELQRRRTSERDVVAPTLVDEKGEQLTPTSAWRAAERLAKVAIMRKSMNRVSDLHGFENARF